MANDAKQRRVVRGLGVKRRWHKVEFESFEDPTVIIDVGWQNLP